VVINLVDYFQVVLLEDFSKTWIDTPETMQLSSGGGAENPNRTMKSTLFPEITLLYHGFIYSFAKSALFWI
jgi:hypothetical protein